MKAAELAARAAALGLDGVGAAPAAPYADTERAIADRRARGLFGSMRFTTARPEVSCHPEALLPGARTVVSAALAYWAPGPEPGAGEGRLPRYTRTDAYAVLHQRLDALGRGLGGAYRVLVDDNAHVDREAAARAGVGFYGKSTMLITPRDGTWVVLGTLVTDVEIEASPPLDLDCGDCRLCVDACPTGALDTPGELDARLCLSWLTQAPGPIPEEHRAGLGAQAYGCDVCQDVCPWNRAAERRRAGEPDPGEAVVSLVEWLESDPRALRERYARLYVPRHDGRHLQRNALVALGNTGRPGHLPLLDRIAAGDEPLLAEHARWAAARIRLRAERDAQA